MLAAKLDRIIDIKSTTETKNSFGEITETETIKFSGISATVTYNSGDLKYDTGDINTTIVFFTIRYINNLKYTDIIIYNGDNYEIINKQELGRREGIKIKTKLLR